jgi:hypothetical protein
MFTRMVRYLGLAAGLLAATLDADAVPLRNLADD